MKFLLDEGADVRLAIHLKTLGHDVTTIVYDYTTALRDVQVLAIAVEESRVLITNDRDFGALVFQQGLPHSGVILLRLPMTQLPGAIERVNDVLSRYSDRLDRFLVVTAHQVRVR